MRTINFILPISWFELTTKQLLFVSKLLLADFAKTKFRFLTHVLAYAVNMDIKPGKSGTYLLSIKGSKKFILTTSQVHSVASKLDFLLDKVTEVRPIPRIRRARAIHFRLYKTTFSQFLSAENFHAAYKATGDVKHLNCLVATLYLKRNQTFSDSLIKKRSRYFRFVRIHKKYSAFLWYSGFRWFVAQECPNLFNSNSTGKELNIKDHLMNMIRGLSQGDVTKNDKILEVSTWEGLYELDAKAKESNDLKSKTV